MFFSTMARLHRMKPHRRIAAWSEHALIVNEMTEHIQKGDVGKIIKTCLHEWTFFEPPAVAVLGMDESTTPAHLALRHWHSDPTKLEQIFNTLQRIYCGDIVGLRRLRFPREMLPGCLLDMPTVQGQSGISLATDMNPSVLQACMQSWPEEEALMIDLLEEGAESFFESQALQGAQKEKASIIRGTPEKENPHRRSKRL